MSQYLTFTSSISTFLFPPQYIKHPDQAAQKAEELGRHGVEAGARVAGAVAGVAREAADTVKEGARKAGIRKHHHVKSMILPVAFAGSCGSQESDAALHVSALRAGEYTAPVTKPVTNTAREAIDTTKAAAAEYTGRADDAYEKGKREGYQTTEQAKQKVKEVQPAGHALWQAYEPKFAVWVSMLLTKHGLPDNF